MTDVQLDLFAEAGRESRERAGVPCLFGSPARGLAARAAEYEAWTAEHGCQGSALRSHAWQHAITHPDGPTVACRPSALWADTRCGNWRHQRDCSCAGGLLYRGACTGCDWEGLTRDREMPAVEDAHDHAWPGWRDLPVITTRQPSDRKALARWWDGTTALYPAGWIASGGPVRIARDGRHNGSHGTPFGGYDMAAEVTG